jgi:hypothetical protein
MFGIGAGMAALVGVILVWFFLITPVPETVFITIPLTEYKSPLMPPDAFADEDSKALLKVFPNGKGGFDAQSREPFLKELAELRTKKAKALIFHLAAYALTRNDQVEILPGDVAPEDDPSRRIPLADVLDTLKACPAQHKLLLLDIMHPLADARLGVLADNVAARVPDAVVKAEDPNLLVLCACSPGQVARVAASVQQSAFGYYLVQGLQGSAAGYNAEKRASARISVKDLAAFVQARVDRWALDRGTRQTPLLLGTGADFELITYDPHARRSPPDLLPPEAYPFQAAWQERDAWREDGSEWRAPRACRELEACLFRAERRWRAGVAPEQGGTALEQQLAGFRQRRQDLQAPAKPEPEQHQPDPETVQLLAGLLKKRSQGPAPKPEDDDKDRGAVWDKLSSDAARRDLGLVVLEAIAADPNPRQVKLRFLRDLLRAEPAFQVPGLTLLNKLADLGVDERFWPTAAVACAFRVAREEARITAVDPRFGPWVAKRLEAARKDRAEGERLLVSTFSDDLARAEKPLARAEQALKGVQEDLRDLQWMRRWCEYALTYLPAYAPYLFGRPGSPPPDTYDDWRQAVRLTRQLEDGLALASGTPAGARPAPPPLDNLRRARQALEKALDRLDRPFTTQPDVLLERARKGDGEVDPRLYTEIEAILTTPFLLAEKRAELWKALVELDHRLQQQTRDHDLQEDQSGQRTRPPRAFREEQGDWERWELERAKRRAQVSLDLFGLGGFDPVQLRQLQQQADAVFTRRAGPEAWDALAAGLRQVWTWGLFDQYDKDPAVWERLRWVVGLSQQSVSGAPPTR